MAGRKHTPGPFWARRIDDGTLEVGIWTGGQEGSGNWIPLARRIDGFAGREDEGNAYLFAAAPHLLEALEAQEAFDNHCQDCEDCASGSHCETGIDLSTKAQTLRAKALCKARREEAGQ